MKTVSSTFSNTISTPDIHVKRQVLYKRRYWNGSVYVWEAAWTALPETQIIGVSPITLQLDTQTENEFQISSTTITLMNFQNQWTPTNPLSVFGADTGSSLGYIPFWMKFQIQSGLLYSSGTSELLTIFTGLVTDMNFNTTDQQVQMTVSGEQVLLTNANAQNVSNLSTNETIGTGNASIVAFNTAQTGVGIVQKVYVAGILKVAGIDYTLSNVDVPGLPTTVTFVTAPASGAAITCTYIYWYQNQKLESLVTSLVTYAGIASGNQQISPVSFPNLITGTHTWSGQTTFETGTIQNVGTRDGTSTLYAPLPYEPGNFYTGWTLNNISNGGTQLQLTNQPLAGGLYGGGTTQQIGYYNLSGAQPLIALQQYTSPSVAVNVTNIAIPVWGDTTGFGYPATVAMVVYADNGSSLPNYSSNLYTSSNYIVSTWPGSISYSVGAFVLAANTKIWIGWKVISVAAQGSLTAVAGTADASAVSVKAATTSSPSFVPLKILTSTSGPTFGSQLGMKVTLSFAPVSSTGTATSPTYDTGSIGLTNTITPSYSGSIPSGTSVSMEVDGSPDGTTWTYVTSGSPPSPFTSNYRYWRVIFTLSASNTTNTVTLLPASPFFLDFGSSGTWISPVLDMTTTPSAFGTLALTQALNNGTVAYYTSTSSDNVTFDAFVAVSGVNIPQSTLKRYVKLKAVITQGSGRNQTPTVASMSLVWYTSTILISLADFSGMTCYDAVTAIAEMANYEFGFDASENFFFRPKSVSTTPILSLNQSQYVTDVLAQTTGASRVYSSVLVTYGSYTVEIDDPGGLSTSPSTQFGFNQLQPGSSQMLISPDANLAQNIAQTLFNFWSISRKQTKIQTTFLPQLDLSDIISLTFQSTQTSPSWFWGDTNVYWGESLIYYYSLAQIQMIPAMVCKVVGFRLDTDDWSCEYDLEEVH